MSTKLSLFIIFMFTLLVQSPLFGNDTNHNVADENQQQIFEEEGDSEEITSPLEPENQSSPMEDDSDNLIDEEESHYETE